MHDDAMVIILGEPLDLVAPASWIWIFIIFIFVLLLELFLY